MWSLVIKLFSGLGIGRDEAGACERVVIVLRLLLPELMKPN